jgi:hypothetical protein
VDPYYYAQGRRIDLQDDLEHVAIDAAVVPKALVSRWMSGPHAATRLPGGVLLLPLAALSAAEKRQLEQAGALRPVFRQQEVTLVPMPEVRVELDNKRQRQSVETLLEDCGDAVAVAQDDGDTLLLKPASGDPLDALRLANDLHEKAQPAAASIRFVQLVPRAIKLG